MRLGREGNNYMTWAAKMVTSLQTGVPWTMCKDGDTPDPLVRAFLQSELPTLDLAICIIIVKHISYVQLSLITDSDWHFSMHFYRDKSYELETS